MARRSRAETMQETRARLLDTGRRAFAAKGFAAASMDDLTAEAGVTRGALYHNFGDKKGLLAAVITQIDGEMAARARDAAASAASAWDRLIAEAAAYVGMALDPDIRRIVLLDGPAFLGDPSAWPSQNSCLELTKQAVSKLMDDGMLKPVDVEAAARLLNGAALNAALWVAASDEPSATMPKAIEAFNVMASGLLKDDA